MYLWWVQTTPSLINAPFRFQRCTTILDAEGKKIPFSSADRNQMIREVIEKMAGNGLRTICLAYRDFPEAPDWEQESQVVSNLTCIAITGIQDPVRPEVRS